MFCFSAYPSTVCHRCSDGSGRYGWACRSSVWRNARRTALVDPSIVSRYLLVFDCTGHDMTRVTTMIMALVFIHVT